MNANLVPSYFPMPLLVFFTSSDEINSTCLYIYCAVTENEQNLILFDYLFQPLITTNTNNLIMITAFDSNSQHSCTIWCIGACNFFFGTAKKKAVAFWLFRFFEAETIYCTYYPTLLMSTDVLKIKLHIIFSSVSIDRYNSII